MADEEKKNICSGNFFSQKTSVCSLLNLTGVKEKQLGPHLRMFSSGYLPDVSYNLSTDVVQPKQTTDSFRISITSSYLCDSSSPQKAPNLWTEASSPGLTPAARGRIFSLCGLASSLRRETNTRSGWGR